MNCTELHEQVGAYALGALEPEERAAVERHLESEGPHDGCREALERARTAVERLAEALPPVRPGDAVWRNIEARLDGGAAAPASRRRAWMVAAVAGWVVAAAALILLWLANGQRELGEERAARLEVALSAADGAAGERDECRRAVELLRGDVALHRDAVALLEHSATRVVALKPVPGKERYRASAIFNAGEKRALVLATSLAVEEGKTYQLWVTRPSGAPLAAGFLRSLGNGMAVGEIDPALLATTPAGFAVSLEPAGGSPAPTVVLMAGALEG